MSQFTAKEVVEILQKARELGCVSLKLAGFEASFDPQIGANVRAWVPPAKEPDRIQESTFGHCEDCEAPKVESRFGGKPYCWDCWMQNKKERT